MPTTYVRHAREGEFQLVSPGTFVRDLGVGDLTDGELTAQVVHLEPEGAHVEKLHRHDEGFSLAYVLEGWLDVEFEEIGVQHLGRGTVIPAFNGPMHRELDCGNGFRLLLLVTKKSVSGDDRQRIVVQQERDAPRDGGRGDGFLYRDFEMQAPSRGRIAAHAMKPLPGKRNETRAQRRERDFRFVYVAAGWVDVTYGDIGSVRLAKDSIAYEPPMIDRVLAARSDDLVMVEVVLPDLRGAAPSAA